MKYKQTPTYPDFDPEVATGRLSPKACVLATRMEIFRRDFKSSFYQLENITAGDRKIAMRISESNPKQSDPVIHFRSRTITI